MSEPIAIGTCKCGGYGQLYNEEAEMILGKCHEDPLARYADESTLKWIAHLESRLEERERADKLQAALLDKV